MTQQTHLPVLALSLIAVMAANVLLIGSISYLIIDSNEEFYIRFLYLNL